MTHDIQVGSIVETDSKSGTYIGKFIEDRGNYWLIEVNAILKHPTQGDLHNPKQAEGEAVVFHERKAPAYREHLNARKRKSKVYSGKVRSYVESLKKSFNQLKKELEARNDAYGNLALEKIADLDQSFYQKIYDKAGEH